jgi:hypothetical protein
MSRPFHATDARLVVTLATGLILGVAAVVLTLSQAPLTLARTNIAAHANIGSTNHTISACQSGERLPRGTSAVRLRVFAFLGPRVTVRLLARGRVIAAGERGSGWTGGVVTVPVQPLVRTVAGVTVCFTLFVNGSEYDGFRGAPATGALAAYGSDGALHGRVRVEYLRPGASSWWSLARAVVRRAGLGRGWPGRASAPLALALMGCVALLCIRLLLRTPR